MGASLEDEELAEMVRDFIESEPTSQNPVQIIQNPTFLSLQEIMGKVMDCEGEVYDKIVKYLKEIGMEGVEEEKTKEMYNNVKKMIMMKWIVLRLKMEKYEASVCKSSWLSAFGPPFPSFSTPSGLKIAGDYEYIDVMIEEEDGKKTRLIIDMDFRSQFELVRPTESYTELKNLLPKMFVGSENKLSKIINVLCSAAKDSLTKKGLHIPPWRKVGYMKSKWFSHNCQKLSFSSMV